METKTTKLVASPNIQGNIGSCEVKKTEYSVDSWHSGVILQDSCSGKMLGQYEYYDYSYVYYPAIILVLILGVFGIWKILFNNY